MEDGRKAETGNAEQERRTGFWSCDGAHYQVQSSRD